MPCIFMEEITKEVDSESSENSVEIEKPVDGNLSVAEFADQLMKRKEGEDTEPETTTEEIDESTEEAVDPMQVSEVEDTQSAEETEEEDELSPPPQPSDVLSKFNIDLDSLSEEDSRDLAKALNASAVKRFGTLTRQKKELQAENEALQEKAKQAEEGSVPSYLQDNALSDVTDEKGLVEKIEQFNDLIEWVDENLDNEIQYDEQGNEFIAKNGDQTFTKTELKKFKADAKRMLRKDVPSRNAWLAERKQADELASQSFNFLSKPESNEYKLFMEVKDSPMYEPLKKLMPNANYAMGLMVMGYEAMNKKNASQPKSPPKPKAPVASTEAGTSRPKSNQSMKLKAVEVARKQYESSGSMADYQQYLKIKKS
jgi:hypothetical protein